MGVAIVNLRDVGEQGIQQQYRSQCVHTAAVARAPASPLSFLLSLRSRLNFGDLLHFLRVCGAEHRVPRGLLPLHVIRHDCVQQGKLERRT